MKEKIIGILICTLLTIATVIPAAGNIKTESTIPYKSINTYVNEISPYNIPTSTLKITATGANDLDSVTLYYRWSTDNISWTGLEEYTIFEGFESGTQNTSLWDTYQTGGDARLQFNFDMSHNGFSCCGMDDNDNYQYDYSLNVLYTNYDFTDARNINIEFWEREWTDNSHNAPDHWNGWGNFDVVAFTNNGNTWYEIISESQLNSQSYKYFSYNISADSDFSSPPSSSFAIAFQQYDNTQFFGDGRAWDDIYITYSIGAPSVDWTEWDDSSNPDTSYPWSWDFNFPKGTGYYEFYSIGKKTGESDETAPTVADAICRFTKMPEIYDENPKNGSDEVEIYPQLDISISDGDGDPMTINWYSNSGGSWKAFASNKDVEDGTYSQNNDNFSDFDTTYYWYVTVKDGIYTNYSPVFHFTTEENLPPYKPNNPDPSDGATNVPITKILKWSGGDPNTGDKVTYDIYLGTSSPPPLVAEDLTFTAFDPDILETSTKYYWQVDAKDSQGLTNLGPIWSFTTEDEPNEPPARPEIYGSPNGPPGKDLYWLFVSDDPEKNQVKYIIDWGDDSSDETDYYPPKTAVELSHTYQEQGEYTIKARAEDERGALSEENTFTIKIQKSRTVCHRLLLRLFERFPILEKLLNLISKI